MGGKKSSNTTTTNNNTIVWKILAFLLFAILILFATDVLEFRQASSAHNRNSSSSTASMIDGSVEQKRPTVVDEDRSGTENAKVDAELAEAKKKIEQEEGAAGAKKK